jgi:S-DNA-T family DNA segregation ATPase FtsK/SpoIIIE
MRAAELAGDFERLDDWEQRAEKAKDRRHKRAMDWVKAPFQLAKALAAAVLTLVGLLVLIGIVLACAQKDIAAFLDPFTAAMTFVRWVVVVVTIVWGPLVLARTWWRWRCGTRAASAQRFRVG